MREHRVVGPPGTGKTTYLKRQFERAAERFGVENVYACSLTRTASAEVASRVERVPKQNIGTLHSHAYRLLKYPTIVESKKGLTEWNDWCGVGRWRIGGQHSVNPEYASLEPTVTDTDGEKLLQSVGVLRQRMVPVEIWPTRLSHFAARWTDFKRETGYLDFTDLIQASLDHVDCIPGCRVLFVDEAQDMSRLEFSLARKWGRKCDELVIVGDPDQNLYEWRGSDPDAFYATDATSEHVLAQSYRVPKAPHGVARNWIKRISDRVDAPYDPVDRDGAVEHGAYRWKEPNGLVNAINRSEGSVMILASCGYMLNPIIAQLRNRGVPFHNPYRTTHGGWNPLNGAGRLLAFVRPNREVWGDDARLWTWNDLRRWTEVLQSDGTFKRGFKSKVEVRCSPVDRFDDTPGDQLVDLQWVLEMCADDATRDAVVAMDLTWWESRLRHNHLKSQTFPLSVARTVGADRLLQRPRITVGTIHSVKGGESDHVYLFPDLSPIGYYNGWKSPGKARSAVVRQFYVGMTRTKETLCLCSPSSDLAVKW